MKKLLASLTLAIAAFGMVGGTASAAPRHHVTKMHMVAKQSASGGYAVAMAAGNSFAPAHLELVLSASPRQSATVSWDLVCTEHSGGIGSRTGQVKMVLPTVKPLSLPAPSSSCIVSANAQLSGTGSLTVAIED